MARRRKIPTVQIAEGAWYALQDYDRHVCCDCGLTHRARYMLEKGRIFERVTVDQRATRAERKKHGIVVLRQGRA